MLIHLIEQGEYTEIRNQQEAGIPLEKANLRGKEKLQKKYEGNCMTKITYLQRPDLLVGEGASCLRKIPYAA